MMAQLVSERNSEVFPIEERAKLPTMLQGDGKALRPSVHAWMRYAFAMAKLPGNALQASELLSVTG